MKLLSKKLFNLTVPVLGGAMFLGATLILSAPAKAQLTRTFGPNPTPIPLGVALVEQEIHETPDGTVTVTRIVCQGPPPGCPITL